MNPFLRRLAHTAARPALTLLIVVVALVAGRSLWVYYQEAPWTRDGRVAADVVTIAPDVSGLVTQVLVKDNQPVKRGDVLFRIDPDRFRAGPWRRPMRRSPAARHRWTKRRANWRGASG